MSIIEFREPIESDLAHLILLNRLHKHKFLADGESLPDDTYLLMTEHGFNLEEMQAKRAIVFTVTEPDGFERVIGSADFTDVNHDLTAVLHFIMEPRYVRRFLMDKVYLDALLDRFRVLRVKKFLVVSEFFATTAHKLAEAIGFKKVAILTDIVRQKQQVGDTFQYVVGDLYYFELTRKDLAKAMQAHFIAEEIPAPVLPKPRKEPKTHVKQQAKKVRSRKRIPKVHRSPEHDGAGTNEGV